MPKRVRVGTDEEWREIGKQTRAAQIALRACVRGTVTELVPPTIVQRLQNAVRRFDDVVREFEYEMLRRGGPREVTIFGMIAEDAKDAKDAERGKGGDTADESE